MTEENKDLNGATDPSANNGTEARTEVVPTPDPVKAQLDELTNTVTNLAEALTKSQSDAENYKNGMLVAKKKLKENGFDDEPDEKITLESISKVIDDKLNPIIEKINAPEKDNLVKDSLQKVEELKLALANRSQISNSAAGTSTGENPEVKNNFFSEAQLADLKAKKLDPKKVEANMRKYKGQI